MIQSHQRINFAIKYAVQIWQERHIHVKQKQNKTATPQHSECVWFFVFKVIVTYYNSFETILKMFKTSKKRIKFCFQPNVQIGTKKTLNRRNLCYSCCSLVIVSLINQIYFVRVCLHIRRECTIINFWCFIQRLCIARGYCLQFNWHNSSPNMVS